MTNNPLRDMNSEQIVRLLLDLDMMTTLEVVQVVAKVVEVTTNRAQSIADEMTRQRFLNWMKFVVPEDPEK
jgi:AAA+ superfamily predicted ATPase